MLAPGQGITIEIAFTTAPDDPAPAFEDVSAFVRMSPGISIARGRSPEGGQVSPGTCTLTLDNSDGRFTPERTTSPYYPNVTLGRRMRVRYRDPANVGNLVTNSTFEVDTAGWIAGVGSTIAQSAVRAWEGTKSLASTISAGSTNRWAETTVSGLVIGQTYSVSGYVWVPAGNLATTLYLPSSGGPQATTTVTNAWERLTGSFVATAPTTRVVFMSQVLAVGVPGDTAWIDGVMVDNGATVQPFTSAAPQISDRFTGFIDSWPLTWPSVTTEATSQISATDRLKRLASGRRKLRAVIQEEILADLPVAYWPLSEQEGSSTAGDVAGQGRAAIMATTQYGSGGTIAFGAGTGPATDGLTAPIFTPVDASNGKTLVAVAPSILNPGPFFFPGDVTAECEVATTATSRRILALSSDLGEVVSLEVSSTGKLRLNANGVTADSASNVNTGATRNVAFTIDGAGDVRAWMDGVNVATVASGSVPWIFRPGFRTVEVGGAAGLLLAGTVSHVAVYSSAVSSARLLAHLTAGATGFAGERSDQRVARYLGWGGVAVADMVLDVGMSTSIAHVDTTGSSVVDAVRRIEETENGILFVDRSGACRFHARSRRYNATPVVVASSSTRPGMSFDYNDQGFANEVNASREGGISYRALDDVSAAQYGIATTDISLVTTSDAEVVDAAEWRVLTNSTPSIRTPAQRVDLLSNDALRSALLALDVSSYISVTSLPSQAGATSAELFVEGYTESIDDQSWDLALNTSPANKARAWQLGVSGASELGTTTRLTY